jgi:hypothetical protein
LVFYEQILLKTLVIKNDNSLGDFKFKCSVGEEKKLKGALQDKIIAIKRRYQTE